MQKLVLVFGNISLHHLFVNLSFQKNSRKLAWIPKILALSLKILAHLLWLHIVVVVVTNDSSNHIVHCWNEAGYSLFELR